MNIIIIIIIINVIIIICINPTYTKDRVLSRSCMTRLSARSATMLGKPT